ncbi:MAG: isoprenylcysteine carboxylmethyltransferase family protein [Symploca sp. SIO2G7]|nr:isoprenylcysteine carboxylmethyltransferase family protein [Symploca sp. SIO2G7]
MFRWVVLILLAGALSISAFHRRRARLQSGAIPRSLEETRLIIGRVFVAFPLFGGAVLYIINPSWMTWASFAAPSWVRWFGIVLGLFTLPAVHWVLKTLGQNVSETVLTKDQQELVSNGPYRWVRHPLYTTGIALFVALSLIAANWFILLFALLALISIRLVVVPREEQELSARFGTEYEQYIQRTGAIFPRLRTED